MDESIYCGRNLDWMESSIVTQFRYMTLNFHVPAGTLSVRITLAFPGVVMKYFST